MSVDPYDRPPSISALYVFPVKSCRGIRVPSSPVVARGFELDRRWMLIDPSGNFVSQREAPELARVTTAIESGCIRLGAPGMPDMAIPTHHEGAKRLTVQLWTDVVDAIRHPGASAWMSAVLRKCVSLVYMPDDAHRHVKPTRGKPTDIVSFVDGYSFLLLSEATLADLNRRLRAPVTIERFRPNIVVTGIAAYAEDAWSSVRLGGLHFRVVKRCTRCAVVNVDPETGEVGREPLRELARYRIFDERVCLGINLLHDATGALAVGETVVPITSP